MHLITVVLQALSLLSLASAAAVPAPAAKANHRARGDSCLCLDVATEIVNGFLSLISAYNNDTANALLADNFVDTSDSIDYLAGIPLGGPTFPSKAIFELGQGSQPPVPISLLKIDAVTCDVIAFRWVAFPAIGTLGVNGIDILYTVNGGDKNSVGPGGWQISQVFSEFNSAAWIVDLGLPCNPSPATPGA